MPPIGPQPTPEASSELGGPDDVVKLVLGGDEILVCESYEVRTSILQQPGVFSLRLGHGAVVRDILKVAQPNTAFRLFINDRLQMTGFTDGYDVDDAPGGSEVTIIGRDVLAPLHDGFIPAELGLSSKTYDELVQLACTNTGVRDTIVFQDAPNRKTVTGVAVTFTASENEAEEEATDTGAPGVQYRAIRVHLGERWSNFLERNLKFAGLFLWAGADGKVVVGRPNAKQKPVARLVRGRGRGAGKDAVNVTRAKWRNHTTPRFSEVLIYGRYGGKKYGRASARGHFFDPEMDSLGYDRPLVMHDVNVSNERQAAFLASRKLAETRRAGYHLEYTVAGHTGAALANGQRAVWSINTVVEVDDDEFGIHGPMWVESVDFKRPPTETTLTLVRPDDVLFGEIE